MSGWLPFLLLAAGGVLAAAIALVVPLRARRAETSGVRPTPFVVTIVHVGSLLVAAFATIGTLVSAGIALLSPEVTTRLPFRAFWPQLHPTVEISGAPPATITGGVIDHGEAVITGLSLGTRWLLAGEILAQGAVAVVVPIAFVVLCRQLERREPFAPAAARWGRIAAVTIAVGGIAQQVLGGIGGSRASYEALTVTRWQQEADSVVESTGGLADHGLPIPTVDVDVQFAPIGLALAVWVVAELVAAGARMQAENARLRQDTDGLV